MSPSSVENGKVSVGNYIVERLIQLGVKTVFGVPGDFDMAFLDLIEDHSSVELVPNANELNGGYAADGYARVTGKLAALVTTFGVGELSATNAIAGSHSERVPVVHIVGVPSTDLQAHQAILHHTLGDGKFDAFIKVAENITTASAILTSAFHAPAQIDKVLEAALVKARPVYITLPTDLVNALVDASPLNTPITYPHPDHPALQQTEDFVVERIVQLFESAKKPVIMVDACTLRFHVVKEVEALVKKTGVTFFTSPMGKAALSEADPHFGGVYVGELSLPPIKEAFEGADFIMVVGTMKSDFNSGAFTWKMPGDRTVELHSDHTILQYGRFDKITFHTVLPALTARLGPLKESQKVHVRPTLARTVSEHSGEIRQEALWPLIGTFLRANDVILAETGTSAFGMLEVKMPPGATFAAQVLWGSIGWAGGAVLGASVAAREAGGRRTMVFTGDGSYQLTIQEMSTLIRFNLKPIIFILNNDGYTIERFIHGPERHYNDIQPWKWLKFPEVFGAAPGSYGTYKVSSIAELTALLGDATFAKADKLQVVEVMVGKMDAPRGLRMQAEYTAKANA